MVATLHLSVARFDASTIHSLLDDKSHLDSTRELYKAYTYGGTYEEEEEGGEEEGAGDNFHPMYEYDQYNDEYDDTYDSHHVTATDTVSTEELFSVKRLNEKGLYRRRFESSSEEEGEEEAREVCGIGTCVASFPDPWYLRREPGNETATCVLLATML